ncbi:hypothetical protein [Clostridium butyricum]|uniref:hypothetical protein n=2 Tax=Clostridium TaxID=1485 RepID=UPI0018A8BE41|nr:hypothetical protein [Clostridium butyricum]MDB2140089.1 hypothetical protein [Clostridium butyricum]
MKPILFNTEMVQAILDSRKTTTRRIIKVNNSLEFMGFKEGKALLGKGCCIHETIKAPYMPGDILYVRETWGISNSLGDFARNNRTAEYVYKAGYSKGERIPMVREQEKNLGVWKPSIHMPKDVARIFLKVTSARVERLQDITEDGIRAEGITEEWPPHAMDKFRKLWDSTTKEYRWETNPWVWVIEFERIEKSEVEQ